MSEAENDWNVIMISSRIAIMTFLLLVLMDSSGNNYSIVFLRPEIETDADYEFLLIAENMNNNNNNNINSGSNNSNEKSSQIKDLRRRSPSQDRAPGSPSFSNGGGGVTGNCGGNANGAGSLGHVTETESNSSRGSIGGSSVASSRGGEDSNRSHQSRDEATTPNCNEI